MQAATPETAGVYQGRQTQTSYDLVEPLAWDTDYYWRIDEIGADGAVIQGRVWSFTVADYLIVDGFERYTDDEGNRIYETWPDGYESFDNGSQVGYSEAPFAEQAIVHSGRQSMPLHYTNLGATAYSEAQRDWTTSQDWTVHGLDALVLYVQGRAENDPMRLYVTIQDAAGRSGTVANPDSNLVVATDWQEWPIPFSALAPVDMSQVTMMVIGLGDRANPTSGAGLIYIDDIQVHKAP